jgi:hypothetical protein
MVGSVMMSLGGTGADSSIVTFSPGFVAAFGRTLVPAATRYLDVEAEVISRRSYMI